MSSSEMTLKTYSVTHQVFETVFFQHQVK